MEAKTSKEIVIRSLSRNWHVILLVIVTLTATSLLSLVSPIIYKILIDDVIPNKNIDGLVGYLVLMILVPWLLTFVASVRNYLSTKIGATVSNDLRVSCFEKVLHAKQEATEKITPPQILHRLTRECGRIGEIYVTKDLVTFVSETISLVITLILMLSFNASLTCVCVIAFPASFFLTKFVSRKSKVLDAELSACLEKGEKFLSEVLNKLKTIKLKNAYVFEKEHFGSWIQDYQKIRMKTAITHNINNFLLGDFIINIIYGVIFFISGLFVINGNMTIGTLVSFVAFVPKVYGSLKKVLNIKVTTNVINNAFSAIEEILALPQENTGGLSIEKIETVDFDNVTFHYGENSFGVKGLKLKAQRGQIIGVIGKTGGGKSTLMDLLAGLYTPQEGSISINGYDINALNIDSLRAKISVVTQDVSLFEGTIRENILFGSAKQTKNVDALINVVSLKELVDSLPEGLNTTVGYNGELLSGGERQRIALANALISDGDLILLDEFTSAMDLETERKIMQHIFDYTDKIVIVVSHRIYSLMNCDEIYVLSNGEIIEHGHPSVLAADEKSCFAKLLKDMDYS